MARINKTILGKAFVDLVAETLELPDGTRLISALALPDRNDPNNGRVKLIFAPPNEPEAPENGG